MFQAFCFSLRLRIAIPTINYVICSDGLHKFLVNVHFNVGARQNLTCTRYNTWRHEYFDSQLYSAPSAWNPASARRNRANTFTLLTTESWYLATAYSVYILDSPSQWYRLHSVQDVRFA